MKSFFKVIAAIIFLMQSFLASAQKNPIYGNPIELTSRTGDSTSIYLKTASQKVIGIAWNVGDGKIEYKVPKDSTFLHADSLFTIKVSGEKYFVGLVSAGSSSPGGSDTVVYIYQDTAVRQNLIFGWGFKNHNSYNTLTPIYQDIDSNLVATKSDLHNIPSAEKTDTLSDTKWAADTILKTTYTGTEGHYYLIWNHVTGSYTGHEKQVMHVINGVPSYDTASIGDLITIANENGATSLYQLKDTGWAFVITYWPQGLAYPAKSLDGGTGNSKPVILFTNRKQRFSIDGNGKYFFKSFIGKVAFRHYTYFDNTTGQLLTDTLHPLILISSNHFSMSNDTLYVDTTKSSFNFDSAFATKTTDNLPQGTTNKYWSNSLFDSRFALKTTDNLPEGLANLYWTNARGDARYPQLIGSYANPGWISSLAWSKITGVPTTITGYGITDAITGGIINSPGVLYNTPTTATVSSNSLTFAQSLKTQSANTFFAGPTSGAAATPVFRTLTAADIPTLAYEPSLGNPSTNGYILSSTAAGVRSWIAPASGGSGNVILTSSNVGRLVTVNGTNSLTSNDLIYIDTTAASPKISIGASNPDAAFVIDSTRGWAHPAIKVYSTSIGANSAWFGIQQGPYGWQLGGFKSGTGSVLNLFLNSTSAYIGATGDINGTALYINGGGTIATSGLGSFGTIQTANMYGVSNTSPLLIAPSPAASSGNTGVFIVGAYLSNGGTSGSYQLRVGPIVSSVGTGKNILQDWGTRNAGTGIFNCIDRIFLNGHIVINDSTDNGYWLDVNGTPRFTRPFAITGSTPSYSLGSGAGTGATASITGNDGVGYLTINTGASTLTGDLITITFNTALINTPKAITLTPANDNAIDARVGIDQASASTTSFKIRSSPTAALTASTTYKFYYTVTQ